MTPIKLHYICLPDTWQWTVYLMSMCRNVCMLSYMYMFTCAGKI